MPDREKVIKEWETVLRHDPLNVTWDLIDETVTLLKTQPEIIRCKDCRNGYPMADSAFVTCGRRFHDGQKHDENWFCADGEPKT